MTSDNRSSDPVTMYRLHSWKMEIEIVQVVKQTECYITYRLAGSTHERRERKEGVWFESWEAAHDTLTAKARRAVEYAHRLLERNRTVLAEIQSMSKPV